MSGIKKDINSTEKLLNVIRGKDEELFSSFGKQRVSLSDKRQIKNVKFNLPKIFFNKKKYTVGVDIGREFICLVKTAQTSDTSHVLVDKKIIRYDSGLSFESSQFKTLLKSCVVDFCGTVADCDIWTKISTSEVSVYFISIPRVPKKQQERVIYWTAKKEGLILDEEKQLFDFEIQGEVVEQGTPKYSVMFYTASKAEVARIKTWADDIGINLAGITIVPFAMQNIFRSKWISSPEETFASLFIGEKYSRIDVYNKENLVMTRGIKTGSTSSMAEAIVSCVREKTGLSKIDQHEAKNILCSMSSESEKLTDANVQKGFKKEEILQMIAPVWERLVRQIDLTLKTASIGNQKVEKIYILSAVNFDKSILDYMSNQLDIKTEFFDPFKNRKSAFSEQTLSSSDRILISPALGFALSNNSRTPNAIFTYQEKNKEISSKRMNRFVFLSFLAALMICLVTLFYQGSRLNYLRQNKNVLEQELTQYHPLLTEETMVTTVDKIKTHRTRAHQYVRKYWGLAVIGEISEITPPNVRLISAKLREINVASPGSPDAAPKENTDDVFIEGIIFNKKDMLESDLAQYVVRLENSSVFHKISVKNKTALNFNKKEVLHFVLSAKIG